MKEYSYQEQHMGTTVSLSFVCPNQTTADTMARYAFDIIKDYEQRFSRFLPTSELSQLNRTGALAVSAEFIEVFKLSQKLAELTADNFNPLVQIKTLGYTRPYQQLTTKSPSAPENTPAYDTDLSQCRLDNKTSHLTIGVNQQLDFGGILKGYLAGKLADDLMATHHTCTGCIINIGGDLATRGMDELHQPFIFNLYNPVTGTELPVTVTNQSLATSGTYARQWTTANGTKHHIVDSKTQQNPTTDLVAVSIIAKDGALTEALTKLFITRGVKEALDLVPPHIHHYQYFAVTSDGQTTSTIPTI